MRIFSYRNKVRLRRAGLVVLVCALVLAVASVAYIVYLGRYMVYSSDGAHLALPGSEVDSGTSDESADTPRPTGEYIVGEQTERSQTSQPAAPETPADTQTPTALGAGYYLSTADLRDGAARGQLVTLLDAREDQDTAAVVLVDVKSEFGNYYYSSSLTDAPNADADISAIGSFLSELAARPDVYLITRVPAFRDTAYALSHTDRALALPSGALWADSGGCYWLDPSSELVTERLAALCTDLSVLGADEVMFSDFCFPDAENITFDGDREAAVRSAMESVAAASPVPVSLSFTGNETSFAAAASCAHVCLSADDGGGISAALAPLSGLLTDEKTQVIFLTASRDTRFDDYLRLRPVTES